MDVKTTWNGMINFTGVGESYHTLPLASDGGGDNASEGFQPMELIAIGLAGCTAMDVISILLKKRQDVTNFEVQVHADRAESHPKVFTRALIEYSITGRGIEEAAVVRAIELSTLKYCPAQAMLGQIMPMELKYQIYEDLGDGIRRLEADGEYQPTIEASQ